MYDKTYTDLMIERGLLKPLPKSYVLDEDSTFTYQTDDEPQNEEKSQA